MVTITKPQINKLLSISPDYSKIFWGISKTYITVVTKNRECSRETLLFSSGGVQNHLRTTLVLAPSILGFKLQGTNQVCAQEWSVPVNFSARLLLHTGT